MSGNSFHAFLRRLFLLLTPVMHAIEVELLPGSAVKCVSACVEHRAADAEQDTDRLSRDQYYYNYASCPIMFPKSLGASDASPMAPASTAMGGLQEADASSLSSRLLLEMEVDTILRGDHSSERGSSPPRSCCDSICCNSAVQQTALRAGIVEPRLAKSNSSKVHSATEVIGESTTPWRDSSENACHAGPGCTLSLRPPPPLSYVTSRSSTCTGTQASARVASLSAAATAPAASSTKPDDARVGPPRVSTAPQPCLPRGWRAVIQESIARFLTVEEATASDASRAACSPCTSSSPVREASAATVASSASSPLPRAPAGEEENSEKHCTARLPHKTAATVDLRPRNALIAPLPVNQTRAAASRSRVSKRTFSDSSAARGAAGVGSGQRDGLTTLVAKRDVTPKTDAARLSSPLAEPARTMITSRLSYTEPKTSAPLDTAATMLAEGPLDAVEAHIFNEAVVTVTCATCQQSIDIFALRPAGTELPEVCYCPLCGSPCTWTVCFETV
ncbi:hypothetical protein LMJF_28_0860 [Leishmania major strain Friedlin]|uniref:Uncharacterized protein n=1 Tax=Leishmania major TaxID=5664 RepID=Q4Q8I1_LEIMA|nr:hypothetical protein LMJF_28_0860 [Leishmania major strain Friedlin]CAJ05193.1 hypothetical protein LMJF_28_0860 [Leishmania major strain Friedlin]|eukprot:XP_001684367.1 hypothetical protein LMJF_28_0860 [Leishmania major strain Friedlin]